MRINTITNWAYGITLLLTSAAGISFIAASHAAAGERKAVEQALVLDELTEQLGLRAERRSDEARLFAMRGSPRHLDAFRREEREIAAREQLFTRLRNMELARTEVAALAEAQRNIAELDGIERAAIAATERGKADRARQLLFGPDHERAQTAVLEPLRRFRELVATRTNAELGAAQERADLWSRIARWMLGLTAALFLAVLYFILRRRVAIPLVRMTGIVSRLARQDYSVEVPVDRRRDEIADMNKAIQVFRENGLERERLEAERRAERRAKDLILQMMHRLQTVQNEAELAEVVACFVPQIFPATAGSLYTLNATGSLLARTGSWLDPTNRVESFTAVACWGVRRGRPHSSNREHTDIPCPHIVELAGAALCVPLSAQGEVVGLLYLEERAADEELGEASRLYLELMAENIGAALANQQLRARLMSLATRDPLTRLLNRRSLDETVNRLVRDGAEVPVSCLMIDIDHFKRFNDQHGHDAGDAVLQHVANVMQDEVGALGWVYRYGGEEFTILLPRLAAGPAFEVAERLRSVVHAVPLAHRGRSLGHISISAGLSTAGSALGIASLVAQADAALLEAKRLGRDQVVAEPPSSAAA